MGEPNGLETKGHIDETARSLAQLRADHSRQADTLERLVDKFTSAVGRPAALIWLTAIIIGWLGANVAAPHFGVQPFDAPPFFWLDGTVSIVSLYLVIFILASQRRGEALAGRRELMALELALLSEQKTAKVIEMLQEFRRDSPSLKDRIDPEAERMAVPSNPTSVAAAISETDPAASTPKPAKREPAA